MTEAQTKLAREIEAEAAVSRRMILECDRFDLHTLRRAHYPKLREELIDLHNSLLRLHWDLLRDVERCNREQHAAPAGSRRGCRTTGGK